MNFLTFPNILITMQHVELQQFGVMLLTRAQAQKIKEMLNCDIDVEFNAQGVDIMTPSFMDELFGWWFDTLGSAQFKQKVVFRNFSDEHKAIVRRVILSRQEAMQV